MIIVIIIKLIAFFIALFCTPKLISNSNNGRNEISTTLIWILSAMIFITLQFKLYQ